MKNINNKLLTLMSFLFFTGCDKKHIPREDDIIEDPITKDLLLSTGEPAPKLKTKEENKTQEENLENFLTSLEKKGKIDLLYDDLELGELNNPEGKKLVAQRFKVDNGFVLFKMQNDEYRKIYEIRNHFEDFLKIAIKYAKNGFTVDWGWESSDMGIDFSNLDWIEAFKYIDKQDVELLNLNDKIHFELVNESGKEKFRFGLGKNIPLIDFADIFDEGGIKTRFLNKLKIIINKGMMSVDKLNLTGITCSKSDRKVTYNVKFGSKEVPLKEFGCFLRDLYHVDSWKVKEQKDKVNFCFVVKKNSKVGADDSVLNFNFNLGCESSENWDVYESFESLKLKNEKGPVSCEVQFSDDNSVIFNKVSVQIESSSRWDVFEKLAYLLNNGFLKITNQIEIGKFSLGKWNNLKVTWFAIFIDGLLRSGNEVTYEGKIISEILECSDSKVVLTYKDGTTEEMRKSVV